ncbi:LysM peptidoglycan-binding domain-containing protein [Vampirovibrio sp.]|uniref:LysM peptidoglycan-binding domain-containing protein n=1 Tax=Vampirovibrio sp. TaxID=2717857 RepID=UPI003593B51A
MMVPKDFGQDFGENHEMPSDTQEKTPGVYVRADNELPQELDMLWSNARPYHKEERNPLISFLAGLLVGAVLTTAVFLLLVMRPQVQTGDNGLMAPANEESLQGGADSATTSDETAGDKADGKPKSLTASKSTTYTVVSGDTLGKIAEKVYGTSAPTYLDKIQRANNMSSPDKLQLDQKLIIPPKDY